MTAAWEDSRLRPLREKLMFTASRLVLAISVVLTGELATAAGGDDSTPNPAAIPLNRDNARHRQLLKLVAKGGGDVVFLGDSITERWESTGAKVWRETFAPLKAVNLGVGGDQTGHVLWRIREGQELQPLTARVAVVLIGINNPVRHRPEEIAGGVRAIVAELKKQKPHIKVLVLGVFPCSLRRQDKRGPADWRGRPSAEGQADQRRSRRAARRQVRLLSGHRRPVPGEGRRAEPGGHGRLPAPGAEGLSDLG